MSDAYLVPFDGEFSLNNLTSAGNSAPKKELKKELKRLVKELDALQRVLYADDRYAVLLVFQAMDAAGKDGTIRAVLKGVNPQGCQVHSFKQPSKEELEHDFLWRSVKALPERGRIGVFNRSYYEETLVVRVHPEYLKSQRIPPPNEGKELWENRFESIRQHEAHLAKNGTVILKFWLNVSKDEQKKRFLKRLREPEKHWKFSLSDVQERGYWEQYMNAYQETLRATSQAQAPWYAIPADNKASMRVEVAKIIVEKLRSLDLRYPEVSPKQKEAFAGYEERLLGEP